MVGKSQSGFTLIEAMASLAIVAVMALGLGMLISRGSDARKTEDLRLKIMQIAKLTEARIRQDLSVAVRPTGSTRRKFSGIALLSEVAPARYPNGGLAIIAERFGQFSTPVDVGLINNDPTKPAITIKVDSSDLAAQYIQAALEKNALFMLGNMEYFNIVRRVGAPTVIGSAPTRVQVQISDDQFSKNEHMGANTTSIRTLEVILYFLENSQIIREVWADLPSSSTSPLSRQVLAENVSQFDMDFAFEDRRNDGLIVPLQRMQNPKQYLESQGCQAATGKTCCTAAQAAAEKCITMNDVRDLKLSTTYYAQHPRLKAQEGRSDGFQYLDGMMQYSTESIFIPLRYSLRGGDIGLVGQSLSCPVNDTASRCNPECLTNRGGPFTNHTLNYDGSYPPDWWEYGDLNSNYCKCWNINGTQIRDESLWWQIPDWNPNGGPNQNINYCNKFYPSCASAGGMSAWMVKNPASLLACWCLQPVSWSYWSPTGPFYSRDMNPSSQTYGEFKLTIDRDLSASGNLLSDMNDNVDSEHNMRCWQFPACNGAAQSYFIGLTRQNPWNDRCGCMLTNLDENGLPQGGDVHRINVDFNKICNTDYFQGRSATPACPGGVNVATNQLRLKSPSNPQGLTETDAAFCACYNAKNFNSTNNPSGNGYDLDFRVGAPLQDPVLPAGQVPNYLMGGAAHTFGARQSLAVSVNAIRIENSVTTTQLVGGNCDRIYCDIRHHAGIDLGCCSANRPVQWTVPVLQQRPQLANILNRTSGSNPGNYLDYVGYCSPECTGGQILHYNDRGNVGEVQRVREIITGTAPGGQVPPICGQWDYGGSSGN